MPSSPQTLWGFFRCGDYGSGRSCLAAQPLAAFSGSGAGAGMESAAVIRVHFVGRHRPRLVTVSLGFIVAVLGTGVTHFFHEHAPKSLG
jgi:hypothetical protein